FKMLSELKIAKLNSQNTCTSYYDFLTCGPAYMQSVVCKPPLPVPARTKSDNESPPAKIFRNGKKFYGVEDTATQWYVHKRRPQFAKCPKPRMFGYKFRLPIRNALNHKSTTVPYRFPGRRISPEFLCLLKRHHASLPGVNRVSKRYLAQKPSFSYYKYDANEKSRPMRPGIETAAPVTFPCRSMVCPRRRAVEEWDIPEESLQVQESGDHFGKEKPKDKDKQVQKSTQEVSKSKPERKKSRKVSPGSAYSSQKPRQFQSREPLLHGLYTTHEPEETELQKKPSRHKSSTSVERKPSSLKSTISVTKTSCYPHIEKYEDPVPPRPSGVTACCEPVSYEKRRRKRDPRRIVFENQPFYQAIKGSNYERFPSKPSKNMVTCSADYERTGYRVRPEPENKFFKSMCRPRQVGVQRSERPDFYDGTDVEMPPDHPWSCCGNGYEGFVHRSDFKDIHEKKKKRKKPPPYCYLWSAVDPNIREEEKQRLAEITCRQRRMCSQSNPYFFYWSRAQQDDRMKAKRQLEKMDRESQEEPYPPPPCFPKPQQKSSHDKSRASVVNFGNADLCQSDAEPTPRKDSYAMWSTERRGREWEARRQTNTDDSPFAWDDDDPPTESCPRNDNSRKHMWSGPLATDSDRALPEKPRWLPRLNAFAKRLLFHGPSTLPVKPNLDRKHSERERSKRAAICRKVEKETPYCIQSGTTDGYSSKQIGAPSNLESKKDNYQASAREQPRIQDVKGPRDPSFWERTMALKRRSTTSPKPNRTTFYNPNANCRPSTLSPGRGKARTKTKGSRMPERKRSATQTSLSSDSSGDETKDTCKKRESRAQREWEERRQRRKAKKCREGFARTSNDWFLTYRSPEPRHPDPRRSTVLTMRNCEFPREPSDPALISARGDRFLFVQHPPKRRRRRPPSSQAYTSQCSCDDRSRRRGPRSRMRGGIDYREGDYLRQRRRVEEVHGFPTRLPDLVNNKRVHYTKSLNFQKHCFCFD
ncbi:hypothetical protein KR074_011734, partial [Drosophila pseudoananassae]